MQPKHSVCVCVRGGQLLAVMGFSLCGAEESSRWPLFRWPEKEIKPCDEESPQAWPGHSPTVSHQHTSQSHSQSLCVCVSVVCRYSWNLQDMIFQAGQYIDISDRDMKPDIMINFGYCDILMWNKHGSYLWGSSWKVYFGTFERSSKTWWSRNK